MGNLMPLSLFCLVFILSSLPCHGVLLRPPFWRRTTLQLKPTLLPPIDKDPEFYRKLREEIPTKKETAKKIVTNILRIRPGGKRQAQNPLEDVVIVMDGSGSIGACEFDNGKKAMKRLVEYDQPGIDAKYAMVTFGSRARRDFNFLPRKDAAARISAVKFPNGWTNTQAGLADALDLFNTGSRGFLSRKLVLLLTDGQSNIKKKNTIPNAQKLKDRGVEVFVIAVGGRQMRGINEMAHIASFPPADFLFRVEKVGEFLEAVQLAIDEVAPGQYKILKAYTSPSCMG